MANEAELQPSLSIEEVKQLTTALAKAQVHSPADFTRYFLTRFIKALENSIRSQRSVDETLFSVGANKFVSLSARDVSNVLNQWIKDELGEELGLTESQIAFLVKNTPPMKGVSSAVTLSANLQNFRSAFRTALGITDDEEEKEEEEKKKEEEAAAPKTKDETAAPSGPTAPTAPGETPAESGGESAEATPPEDLSQPIIQKQPTEEPSEVAKPKSRFQAFRELRTVRATMQAQAEASLDYHLMRAGIRDPKERMALLDKFRGDISKNLAIELFVQGQDGRLSAANAATTIERLAEQASKEALQYAAATQTAAVKPLTAEELATAETTFKEKETKFFAEHAQVIEAGLAHFTKEEYAPLLSSAVQTMSNPAEKQRAIVNALTNELGMDATKAELVALNFIAIQESRNALDIQGIQHNLLAKIDDDRYRAQRSVLAQRAVQLEELGERLEKYIRDPDKLIRNDGFQSALNEQEWKLLSENFSEFWQILREEHPLRQLIGQDIVALRNPNSPLYQELNGILIGLADMVAQHENIQAAILGQRDLLVAVKAYAQATNPEKFKPLLALTPGSTPVVQRNQQGKLLPQTSTVQGDQFSSTEGKAKTEKLGKSELARIAIFFQLSEKLEQQGAADWTERILIGYMEGFYEVEYVQQILNVSFIEENNEIIFLGQDTDAIEQQQAAYREHIEAEKARLAKIQAKQEDMEALILAGELALALASGGTLSEALLERYTTDPTKLITDVKLLERVFKRKMDETIKNTLKWIAITSAGLAGIGLAIAYLLSHPLQLLRLIAENLFNQAKAALSDFFGGANQAAAGIGEAAKDSLAGGSAAQTASTLNNVPDALARTANNAVNNVFNTANGFLNGITTFTQGGIFAVLAALGPLFLASFMTIMVMNVIGASLNDTASGTIGSNYCFEGDSRIANSARLIVEQLTPGWWGYYNKPTDPSFSDLFEFTGFAEQVAVQGTQEPDYYQVEGQYGEIGKDMFWCTWLVVHAYNSNMDGDPVSPSWLSVGVMKNNWEQIGPVIAADEIEAKDIPLGSAVFFGKDPVSARSSQCEGCGNAHVGIVCGLDFVDDAQQNGTMTTCESNNVATILEYTILNGKVQGNSYLSVDFFGMPGDLGGSCEAGGSEGSNCIQVDTNSFIEGGYEEQLPQVQDAISRAMARPKARQACSIINEGGYPFVRFGFSALADEAFGNRDGSNINISTLGMESIKSNGIWYQGQGIDFLLYHEMGHMLYDMIDMAGAHTQGFATPQGPGGYRMHTYPLYGQPGVASEMEESAAETFAWWTFWPETPKPYDDAQGGNANLGSQYPEVLESYDALFSQ